jgi:hypothetical protein
MRDIDLAWSPADLTAVPVPPQAFTNDHREAPINGRLTRLEIGSGQVFGFVTFQLPNFTAFVGDWVRQDDRANRARVVPYAAGWRVTGQRRACVAIVNNISAPIELHRYPSVAPRAPGCATRRARSGPCHDSGRI